jgi:predicted nucleic acid-binding protein
MLWDGRFNLSFSLASEARAIVHLRRSYRNVPMSLADACLVRLSELHPKLSLITFDSDFHIYRRNKRQLIPIIAPPIV